MRAFSRPGLRAFSRPGLLVGLAYLGFLGLGVRSGLLGVAWPFIQADFGVPLDALGALLGPFSVGYLLGSFVSGAGLARWNLGVLLAASFAGMVIFLLGSAVAPVWWLLLVVGLPGGLGTGMIDAGLNTYVANHHGPRQMNWLHASWGVGVTLSPLMMTAAITSGQGWRWGYAVSGCLLLALAGAYLATRNMWPSPADVAQREPAGAVSKAAPGSQHSHANDGGQGSPVTHWSPGSHEDHVSNVDQASQAAGMWQTLQLPVAWLSMLLFIVYTGVELGIGQWAFPLLTGARGMGTVEAGAAVAAYWAGLTLGRIFFGAVVAAIGVERLLRGCLLSVLLGLGLLWLPTTPAVAFVLLALLGAVIGPIFPTLVTMTPDRFGAAHTANAVGFQVAASVIGGAGLPALLGFLARAFGLDVIVPTLLGTAFLQIACYVAWARTRLS